MKTQGLGWHRYPFLMAIEVLLIGGAPPTRADELVYYAYPSPAGIRWNTPRSLGWSAVFSSLKVDPRFSKQHEIGHANVELSCDATPQYSPAHEFTGMTSSDDADLVGEVFHRKAGLGVLLTTFPGRLETAQEILEDLPARYEAGKIAYLRFKINSDACRRTLNYLDEYRSNGYDRFYGLPLRPLHREGGGCTAFATSVLEVAGLLDEEFTKGWSKSIRIPEILIGGGDTGHTIPVSRLLVGRASRRWARPEEPGVNLSFWDPDAMFRWINHEFRENFARPRAGWTNERRGMAKGIAIDRVSSPVPSGPFWKN